VTDLDHSELSAALAQFEIELPEEFVGSLERYRRLLLDWNERLNLTRHTDPQAFVARDVVDSIHLANLLDEAEEVLDIGTGGGVPGVILAILRPDLRVSLCESVAKKAKAVDRIVDELQLPVPVHHARAEELLDEFRYDTLTARAVAPLSKLVGWLAPHWHSFRRLLVIKGPRWVEERGDARHQGLMHHVELRVAAEYLTPSTGAENVILSLIGRR